MSTLENKEITNKSNSPLEQINITTNADNATIKKKPISTKTLIIFGVSIIVLAVVLTIILVLITRKKNKSRYHYNPNNENKDTETELNYDEAVELIGSEKTNENHDLFNQSSTTLDILKDLLNNISFNEINITVNDSYKSLNLSSFLNESYGSNQVIKEDLDLYSSRYDSLSKEINVFSKDVSNSYKNLSNKINDCKVEIDNITLQFEKTIQNLSIPLSLYLKQSNESNKLRILESDGFLTKFREGIDKVNNHFNKIGTGLKEAVDNVVEIVDDTSNKVKTFIIDTTNGIKEFGRETSNFIGEKSHELLKKIKDIFVTIKNKETDLRLLLGEKKENLVYFLKEINNDENKKEYDDIITNLNNLMIEYEIKYHMLEPYSLKIDSFLNLLTELNINIDRQINELNLLDEILNVEISTSLDLLFIIDITGSMSPYINEVKRNIISIINGIIDKCPGIDINLGFIGYRDFYEEYYDIDFTQDHEKLKNMINGAYASGGGDFPEDVAFALELALNKTWKSNAKFAIFIADAPGHGTKYGGDEIYSSYPERLLIEDMIMEMAEKSISLFCLRISTKTDIMYELFENIYNEVKTPSTKFIIVNNNNYGYSYDYSSFSEEIITQAINVYYEQRKDIMNDCLVSKFIANEFLRENNRNDILKPDNNLRFILGKCSPVLLVPGLFATKLVVELNCKGLATEERDSTLKEIRLYCGNTICKNEEKISEEFSLIFSAEGPFSILGDPFQPDKYGSCLGHIANYYQNENECEKVNGKNICYHSKYVKVAYYGGTNGTLKDSRCGVEGIINVVQGNAVEEIAANNGASASFKKISKSLINKGYKEGFSLGALPNDYRRYLATNNFAQEVFKTQIERLYKNTGKPVIIIGHSYGTLLSLTNLIINKDDTNLMKKIKKFIAMAPPFSGSSKLVDIFLHGNRDIMDINLIVLKVNYNIFGQYLLYKSLPVAMELRPLSIAAKIFTDKSYSEISEALKGRLEIERDCETTNCDINTIKSKTEKFDNLYKDYFPSLLDPECSYESTTSGYNEALYRKCYTYIYNVGNCPSIITQSENPTIDNFNKDLYCNKKGKGYYYQGECGDKERNCLDEMYYSDKCPNPFSNKEAVNYILKRFNDNYSEKYGTLDENYFDSYENIREGLKKSIEYQNEKSKIKDLPVPPVDTILLYGAFTPTIASLVLDDDDFTNTNDNIIFNKGGDGTVPTWSSLLTGLKWIYDKKKKNLSQKIKLVEYCSRLSNSGQYKYDPNKDQNFAAIGCRCLFSNSNSYSSDLGKCSHAEMLSDDNLFDYLFSVVCDPKEENTITELKKKASIDYNPNFDYTHECDVSIFNILDRVK